MKKSRAIYLLVLLAIISAFFASTLPQTAFDYNFDKFFKPADPATQYFKGHRTTFSTDNDFILIGLINHEGAFEKDFIDAVDSLTEKLKNLPHVKSVLSPTNATIPVREPLTGAYFERPLLSKNPRKDSLRVFEDPSLVNNLFSRDTSAISIVISTTEYLSKEKSDEIASALESALAEFDFDGIHVSGRAIGQVVYIEKIQREFILFLGIALVFVIILLYVMFRSFRGILIPMGTVLLAVVWSIGILNLSGQGISILLNMLPPVIFVVGMSDAVHMYSRYIEELSRGKTKQEAIRLMVMDTGLATFLTSLTTSIGFASLWFTGIPALSEFGLLTAAGVMAAFVIAIILMPAWLSLTPEPQIVFQPGKFSNWDKFLSPAFSLVIRRKRPLFVSTIILTGVFIFGVTQIDLNNFLLEDLKKGEKVREDFTFFDQYFSGVRPFDLGMKTKTDEPISPAYFEELETLHSYLTNEYGVGAIASPLNALKEINRSRHGGRNEYYALPNSSTDWKQALRDYQRLLNSGKLSSFSNPEGTYIRLLGRVGDWGGQAFSAKNAKLRSFISEKEFDVFSGITITGTGTLIDRTNQNLVESLAKGLGAAFLIIAVLMGFMFRSISMVLIALIPNILPLLAVGTIMAIFGIDLKMSTSIIFTIAFGIAVDDTIHLLSRYKLELVKGSNRLKALRSAYMNTGKALIITSIILFGGFIGLCFSSFQSTFYIGLFVTLTLFFALIFDLSLFPALVTTLPKAKESVRDNHFSEKPHDQIKD